MKKGKLSLAILQALEDGTADAVDLFLAYLNAGYGASYSRLNWEHRKLQGLRAQNTMEREARERYRKLEYVLRKDKLIRRRRPGSAEFVITEKGKQKRVKLLTRYREGIASPISSYKQTPGERLIVVAFDIPEKQRPKRDWLRAVLEHLGLSMV